MAIFKVEQTRDFIVMAKYHLRDVRLSLKAKGLFSVMMSLPEEGNCTIQDLAAICKEGAESIGSGLRELEAAGYILRYILRGDKGRITGIRYVLYEQPCIVSWDDSDVEVRLEESKNGGCWNDKARHI